MMNKLLLLFLISLFLTSSLAEENFRNLGNKWHNKPTAAPHSENVAVTVKEENTGDNVPIDLGTTTITKSWDNPDGSHVKQVTTVEKTCLNGITTTKTTTKTYTYTNVNTEAVEGGQGENVVVVVPIEEEAECETTTTVVTEPESNAENVVVTVEQGETEENIPVDLGTTTVTKSWDNTDGSHVKQVTVIEKTCLNGLITTKTTTTTYTYTYSKPSTSTQEAEAAVESESEIEVNVEAPESVEVEVAVVQENESETESESNIVVAEGGESTGANVAVEVEANVPKYLGTTTITKSWDTANGCHIVQVITKERTCLNGVITIKTTTKTYTYTNVSSHEEEVEAEQETEIIVVAEEEQGENVVVVVPTEEAECETTTTVETEPVNNAGNVAVEVESAEENVVQNLGTTTTVKSWTNSEGCRVKQVITVEKTCLNGVITTKTTTKTYTYPKGGSSNSGKKWR